MLTFQLQLKKLLYKPFSPCSAEQLVDRQKTTAKKRRRNQNAEIDELAKLLPVKALPLGSNGSTELEAMMGESSSRGKAQAVDKISVLRITSTFLKFQEFLKNGYFSEFILYKLWDSA